MTGDPENARKSGSGVGDGETERCGETGVGGAWCEGAGIGGVGGAGGVGRGARSGRFELYYSGQYRNRPRRMGARLGTRTTLNLNCWRELTAGRMRRKLHF